MSRSSKKGPYVDERIAKRVAAGMGEKGSQYKNWQEKISINQNLWVNTLTFTTGEHLLRFLLRKIWWVIDLENFPPRELLEDMDKL